MYQDLREVINKEGYASFEDALRGPEVMALSVVFDQLLFGGHKAGFSFDKEMYAMDPFDYLRYIDRDPKVGLCDEAFGEKLLRKVELSIGLTHSAHFGVDSPRPGVDAVVNTLANSNLTFGDLQIITTGMMDMNLQVGDDMYNLHYIVLCL